MILHGQAAMLRMLLAMGARVYRVHVEPPHNSCIALASACTQECVFLLLCLYINAAHFIIYIVFLLHQNCKNFKILIIIY